jgi:EAL domain-containing protein (putative c-di-GMP-specific phosphodiesterase class I)
MPEMNSHAIERQSIDLRLRRALENEEFRLHYQPKVSLATGEIVGAEALVRWQPPNEALMVPGQFVEIAEECGLIVPIGRWVLKEACRQVRAWQDAGLGALPIAVNVSAVEFRDRDFLEGVKETLAETGLETRYLELELTEGVLMKNVPSTLSALEELRTMGIHLAMDDFGTGYSSLSYLRQYPFDILKIDRSFVSGITSETDNCALVNAIVNMGRSLNCLVVAEGIETSEQKSYLQAHGCPQGQGYLFSRAMDAQQFGYLRQVGGPLTFEA